jgi:hypothetical protein
MTYFKKLEVVFPNIDLSRIVGGSLLEGYGETFRSWNMSNVDYFHEAVSSVIRFKIKPDVSTYTEIAGQGAGPHSEQLQTVLNYYIDPGKCVTFFWRLKNPNIAIETLPMLNDDGTWVESEIRSYHLNSLSYEGSFIAKPNEAWLLSTGSIHSLIKPITKDVRKFFRLGWLNYNVDEIFDSIEIL